MEVPPGDLPGDSSPTDNATTQVTSESLGATPSVAHDLSDLTLSLGATSSVAHTSFKPKKRNRKSRFVNRSDLSLEATAKVAQPTLSSTLKEHVTENELEKQPTSPEMLLDAMELESMVLNSTIEEDTLPPQFSEEQLLDENVADAIDPMDTEETDHQRDQTLLSTHQTKEQEFEHDQSDARESEERIDSGGENPMENEEEEEQNENGEQMRGEGEEDDKEEDEDDREESNLFTLVTRPQPKATRKDALFRLIINTRHQIERARKAVNEKHSAWKVEPSLHKDNELVATQTLEDIEGVEAIVIGFYPGGLIAQIDDDTTLIDADRPDLKFVRICDLRSAHGPDFLKIGFNRTSISLYDRVLIYVVRPTEKGIQAMQSDTYLSSVQELFQLQMNNTWWVAEKFAYIPAPRITVFRVVHTISLAHNKLAYIIVDGGDIKRQRLNPTSIMAQHSLLDTEPGNILAATAVVMPAGAKLIGEGIGTQLELPSLDLVEELEKSPVQKSNALFAFNYRKITDLEKQWLTDPASIENFTAKEAFSYMAHAFYLGIDHENSLSTQARKWIAQPAKFEVKGFTSVRLSTQIYQSDDRSQERQNEMAAWSLKSHIILSFQHPFDEEILSFRATVAKFFRDEDKKIVVTVALGNEESIAFRTLFPSNRVIGSIQVAPPPEQGDARTQQWASHKCIKRLRKIENENLLYALLGGEKTATFDLLNLHHSDPPPFIFNNITMDSDQSSAIQAYCDAQISAFLLASPPGSGKSLTIAMMIQALAITGALDKASIKRSELNRHPRRMILIISETNTACNNLGAIIHQFCDERIRLVSFSSPSARAQSAAVPKYDYETLLLSFMDTLTKDERPPTADIDQHNSYRLITGQIGDYPVPSEEMTEERWLAECKTVEEALGKNRFYRLKTEDLFFQYYQPNVIISNATSVLERQQILKYPITDLIIDEGSTLTRINFYSTVSAVPHIEKLVIVADNKQLGPFTGNLKGDSIKLAHASIFDYLLERDTIPIMALSHIYRMNPELVRLVAQPTYSEMTLVPAASSRDRNLIERKGFPMPVKGIPLAFIEHSSRTEKIGKSSFNIKEIDLINQLIETLVAYGIEESDIAVISPYTAQCNEIKRSRAPKSRVIVSTIDSFQGMEAPVMIISLVRTLIAQGIANPFVSDARRSNVTLTRAKEAMFVIGEISALPSADFWRQIVRQAADEYLIVTTAYLAFISKHSKQVMTYDERHRLLNNAAMPFCMPPNLFNQRLPMHYGVTVTPTSDQPCSSTNAFPVPAFFKGPQTDPNEWPLGELAPISQAQLDEYPQWQRQSRPYRSRAIQQVPRPSPYSRGGPRGQYPPVQFHQYLSFQPHPSNETGGDNWPSNQNFQLQPRMPQFQPRMQQFQPRMAPMEQFAMPANQGFQFQPRMQPMEHFAIVQRGRQRQRSNRGERGNRGGRGNRGDRGDRRGRGNQARQEASQGLIFGENGASF
jgi:hypothetical protein